MKTKTKTGTKKKTGTKNMPARKLSTKGLPRAQADRVAGEIINNALALSQTREKPDESAAVIAVARAWLTKGGFHEDPERESPERVEIQGPGWDGQSQEHYVDVRVFIPSLDVEHVIDGTHPDGITAEAP